MGTDILRSRPRLPSDPGGMTKLKNLGTPLHVNIDWVPGDPRHGKGDEEGGGLRTCTGDEDQLALVVS